MNPILKNILALVAGVILGNIVNMGIIMISGYVIAPPAGADLTTMEGLKASMPLMHTKHFLMPFLAHALGTFTGSLLTAYLAANRKMIFALVVSIVFLIGGITNIFLLPSPTWFTIVDLVGAYIPMGYLAAKLVVRKSV
jgi:hypothetical protein